MEIPCCAIWFNEEQGQIPVIIIQAEEVDGQQLVGIITLTGQKAASTLSELKIVPPEALFQ